MQNSCSNKVDKCPFCRRHDTQHNDIQYDTQHNDIQYDDTQHNDIQHNDIQYNNIQYDTQHNDIQYNDTQHNRDTLSIACRYSEGIVLSVVYTDCRNAVSLF